MKNKFKKLFNMNTDNTEKELQELNEESGETTWHVIAKNGDIKIIQKKYLMKNFQMITML